MMNDREVLQNEGQPMCTVRVTRVSTKAVYAADWDAWAQATNGSFRSAFSHLRAWSVKHHLRSRLALFELHVESSEGRRKIGQCAVGIGKQEKIFLDRLQLLPDETVTWELAMAAVLHTLGSGTYRYGWELNLEPPREHEISTITGVSVRSARPVTVEAVDFSRWGTWDDYWRATSNNIRRNAKKAINEIPDLSLESRSGLRALLLIPALVRLRAAMYRRKGIGFDALQAAFDSVVNILSCPAYVFTAIATSGGKALASFSGSQFGSSTYYTDGGSEAQNSGASWFLMMNMLREAYERSPAGKFVMGYVDHAIHDEAVGGGLLRARRSCRVTDYDTSIVTFRYAGGAG